MNKSQIKVRLAPSPTGFLHIGTGQSALYNWLCAKKMGGKFYLRIEDTDKERSTKEYEKSIFDALTWLGLGWEDEVLHQSERTATYRKALEKLLGEGKAFYCHHSQEELEAERQRQEFEKQPPRHECTHKNLPLGKEGGGIIRLAVDDKSDRKIVFDDVIRGPIEFKASLLGDFSIARTVDDPLYNFAAVVDDAEMEITHVIRGEDHISNTPKQILVYEALGQTPPLFAHLPLILGPDRSKLSKRHGAMALIEYKTDYLPDAIVNFLGGLGYTFSKDVLSREEMVTEFDLAKVHKSGAIFDTKKLNWINCQYIKRLSPDEFRKISGITEISDAAVPLVTERLEKLSDAQAFSYLWQTPVYEKELLNWKDSEQNVTKESIERSLGVLENWDFVDSEVLRTQLDALADGNRGLVYWPLRAALSGKEKSPDPVQLIFALGKEEAIERIKSAINLLS
ncbi:MAG: glutamate--tRNA ligase [Candidatus Pacebacteria bacterium]|nr:glutamate--tRNA ligase [Candidatus Paceibacterota bacterium]